MSKRDEIRLHHMLDAANKAVGFMAGRTRTELDTNEMLMLAVVRLIEILGEAAKNVSQATKSEHPSIPWRQISGTRDRLSHAYFEVNLDVIWSIATQDLPPLVNYLEQILLTNKPENVP